MNRTIKMLLLSVGLLVSAVAFAIDVDSAKRQGLIGERVDGYLGVVVQSAASEVNALVREINAKRQAEYDRIAKANGITRQAVEMLAGKKTIAKTRPGGWIFRTQWLKK